MDEFGRSRRGRGGEDSPSPPPPPPNRRRPRSPSPLPRGERRDAFRSAVDGMDRRHSAGDRCVGRPLLALALLSSAFLR